MMRPSRTAGGGGGGNGHAPYRDDPQVRFVCEYRSLYIQYVGHNHHEE
jgi:hypothetical protein